ncbi:hypothetical protein ECE50_004290 [Chitinophaga sp. Mgbs1]|uniref:Uncharacterized protein n=1 Tax=Chitinophaga solisilvae TaxID=1233460 RepID=A0A3S1B2D7_9BACT|nr:hypothetical protein [Chitinophaga solisilvae]
MQNNISHKDQASLYLTNFISFPYQSSNQDVPVMQFTAGEPLSLSWASNGSEFQLYAAGGSNLLYSGATPSFDLQQGFQQNTTLMLTTNDSVTTLYAFLTIIISNPVLTPDSMDVSGDQTDSGTLTVQQTLYTQKNLTIADNLNTGSNNSFNNISVSQQTNVSGAATMKTLSVNEITGGSTLTTDSNTTLVLPDNANISRLDTTSVTASGTSNISDLTVSGGITSGNASIAMIGSLQLIKQDISFGEMDITAKTDGFAIALIDPTNCYGGTNSYSVITYDGQEYSVNGVYLSENPGHNIPKYGYCCIPVQKGGTWKCSASTEGSAGNAPVVSIYWAPLGGGSDSYTITREAKASAGINVKPPDLQQQWQTDFLQTLAAAMQKDPAASQPSAGQ